MERLDHRRSLNDVEIVEAVEVASRLLRRLSIPVPSDFRSLRLVTQDLCHTLPQRWEQYGRPMPQRWVEQACELAVQLGTSCGNLLVNYDLHYADVLRGKREPWLVVDPKVVIGDPEFGIAQLLWCRLEDIEAKGAVGLDVALLGELEFAIDDADGGLLPLIAETLLLAEAHFVPGDGERHLRAVGAARADL